MVPLFSFESIVIPLGCISVLFCPYLGDQDCRFDRVCPIGISVRYYDDFSFSSPSKDSKSKTYPSNYLMRYRPFWVFAAKLAINSSIASTRL